MFNVACSSATTQTDSTTTDTSTLYPSDFSIGSNHPETDSKDIEIDTNIRITFSTNIDPTTVYNSTFYVLKNNVKISGEIYINGKSAIFSPAANLSYNATYTTVVTTDIKNENNEGYDEDHKWSFTTMSEPDEDAPINMAASAVISNGVDFVTSNTVSLTISATDNVGVTGYYVSESSGTPTVSQDGWA